MRVSKQVYLGNFNKSVKRKSDGEVPMTETKQYEWDEQTKNQVLELFEQYNSKTTWFLVDNKEQIQVYSSQ